MQKNFRFLKGISLVFALVLLVGCSVLLAQNVKASADTVVFYVSDAGDNTLGVDEATAFTSLDSALQKAKSMNLPKGTTVKLLVVGRVTSTTQTVDPTVPLDAEGNRLPILVTSAGGEKADIYLAHFNEGATSSSQYATFSNELYFKDIDITVKVFEERVAFAETADRWCQRNLYFNGFNVTFDNCRVAPERKGDDVPDIIMGLDYSTNNATRVMDKTVTLKNGPYTAAAVFMHQFRVPNFKLTVNLENASFGSVHVCPMTSTATTPDMKKFTVNIGKDVTISNLYITRQGHIDIEEGLTVNYYDGCTIGNVSGTSASDDSGSGFNAPVTHNIYGGNITNFTASPARGIVKQPVVVNMSGGTIGTYYGGGVAAVNDMVSLVNNISGGEITNFYGGPQSKGHIATLTNNITGGTFGTCFMGGKSGNVDTLVNNVPAGTFGTIYGGPEAGYVGSLTNNFSDLSLNYIYGGPKGSGSSDGADEIINNFTNVAVAKELYGAMYAGIVGNVINNFNNVTVGGSFYGGGYNKNSSSDITGTITNNINGISVTNFYIGGVRECKMSGKVINNVYDASLLKNPFYGGGRNCGTNAIGGIENNIYGGTFAVGFYGGNYETGNVSGNIVNRIYGGNFTNVFYGGHRASGSDGETNGNVDGNIINEFYGGVFTKNVFAGSRDTAGLVKGNISTKLAGGSFRGETFNALCAKPEKLLGNATLSIAPSADADYLTILSVIASAKNLTTTISGGDRPLLIGATTAIAANSFAGTAKLLVSQTENWNEDEVYLSFENEVATDMISAINGSASVNGSGVFYGYTLLGSAETASVPAAPGLATMVSFQLEDALGVRFWVAKSDVAAYIEATGKWSYSVSFQGKKVASAVYSSVASIPADCIKTDDNGVEYVTFFAGLGIPASNFGDDITIVLGDVNTTTYTVFDLLAIGAESATLEGDTKLATLLQSIHNYGIEAYNYFNGASENREYAVPVNGTYETLPSVTKDARGYEFVSTSLSLDEKLAMNFYMKAIGEVNFTATAKGSGKQLSADKILVQKVASDMYVVTLKLDAKEMNEVYVLTASDALGTVATCTNSIAYSCTQYAKAGVAAEVAETILAYLESVQAYFVA